MKRDGAWGSVAFGADVIVTASAGLNLPRELLAYCQVEESPHQIVVDGALHDVRSITSTETLREWMRTAKTLPYPLGSSAAEYMALFNQIVKRTNQIVVVTGTRKILGTYDAAVAATRLLSSAKKGLDARVLDTGLVEFGAGLIAAYCGAAARAGHAIGTVVEAGQALADATTQLCVPNALDGLVKSGRPDLAQGIDASSSGAPIIGMKDGEVRPFGNVETGETAATKLIELLLKRYKAGSKLWLSITFGDYIEPAQELLVRVGRHFDVQYSIVRPMGAAGYLLLGPRSLMLSAHPVSAMKLVVRLPAVR